MNTSEDYYFGAKDLYLKIAENYYAIENSDIENKDEVIDQTIDDAEDALDFIDKINIRVLRKISPENIETLKDNIKKIKERVDYILSAVYKIKKYIPKVEQHHPLPPEMWPDKEREEWEEQMKKRRDASVEEKPTDWTELGEGFISLEDYKKIKN